MLQAIPVPADTAHWWTVMVPANANDFWTMVAAIGGVAVFFAVLRGLRSLKLTRTEMKNRATREARLCAIHRCEEFGREIIPAVMAMDAALIKVPEFESDLDKVIFGGAPEAGRVAAARAWVDPLSSPVTWTGVRLLNRLEAWAPYFTRALAESETAFGSCSPVFLTTVRRLYPLILVLRSNDDYGKYPHVVSLFQSWHERRVEDANAQKRDALEQQYQKLKPAGTKYTLPHPIGTKVDE
jgi:hypothetical protein